MAEFAFFISVLLLGFGNVSASCDCPSHCMYIHIVRPSCRVDHRPLKIQADISTSPSTEPARPFPALLGPVAISARWPRACRHSFKGQIHTGQPKGKTTKLYGLDAYVSEPADGKTVRGIVVIIPDAFGWEFIKNRILADHCVEKGDFKVYLPDFMNGWSVYDTCCAESFLRR